MQFEVTILLDVDKDANFLGSDSDFFREDLEMLISDIFYDIDDIKITEVTAQEV